MTQTVDLQAGLIDLTGLSLADLLAQDPAQDSVLAASLRRVTRATVVTATQEGGQFQSAITAADDEAQMFNSAL